MMKNAFNMGKMLDSFNDKQNGQQDVNVILFGETGVGKTTFINGKRSTFLLYYFLNSKLI